MGRHRARHRRPLPRSVRDTIRWGAVAVVVAMAFLAWSGTPWSTVAVVGGLLLALAVASYAALRLSGMTLRNIDRDEAP